MDNRFDLVVQQGWFAPKIDAAKARCDQADVPVGVKDHGFQPPLKAIPLSQQL